jgi:hypothetical protein
MRKPKPRPQTEEYTDDEFLDHLCWGWANNLSLMLNKPQGECADRLKQSILDGHHIIQISADGIRLVPASMH